MVQQQLGSLLCVDSRFEPECRFEPEAGGRGLYGPRIESDAEWLARAECPARKHAMDFLTLLNTAGPFGYFNVVASGMSVLLAVVCLTLAVAKRTAASHLAPDGRAAGRLHRR